MHRLSIVHVPYLSRNARIRCTTHRGLLHNNRENRENRETRAGLTVWRDLDGTESHGAPLQRNFLAAVWRSPPIDGARPYSRFLHSNNCDARARTAESGM